MKMYLNNNSTRKSEILYTESRRKELEEKVKILEKKLMENNFLEIYNSQIISTELNEMQKLLQKYKDQLDHLKQHDSIWLKLFLGLILVIFIVWMIFVLKNN